MDLDVIDIAKLSSPIISCVFLTATYLNMVMSFDNRGNQKLDTISDILILSKDSYFFGINTDYEFLLPLVTCLASGLLSSTVGYIYHSRVNNNTLDFKKDKTLLFISKILFNLTFTLLDATIAVSLRENRSGHIFIALSFFTLIPITTTLDLYIFEKKVLPKLPDNYYCKGVCTYMKRIATIISYISFMKLLYAVQISPFTIINYEYFYNGELLLFGVFIPLGLSLSYDLFLTGYYLR